MRNKASGWTTIWAIICKDLIFMHRISLRYGPVAGIPLRPAWTRLSTEWWIIWSRVNLQSKMIMSIILGVFVYVFLYYFFQICRRNSDFHATHWATVSVLFTHVYLRFLKPKQIFVVFSDGISLMDGRPYNTCWLSVLKIRATHEPKPWPLNSPKNG